VLGLTHVDAEQGRPTAIRRNGPPAGRPATPASPGRKSGTVAPSRPSRVPVTQPGDAVEREADAAASRIAPHAAAPGGVRRSPLTYAPAAVWEALDSPGRPLAGHEQLTGLGIDLSGVRVHTGDRAVESARALAAAAYTVGDDIVLGDRHDTDSVAGRRLLAHELAHVAHQRSRPGPAVVHREGDQKRKAPMEIIFIIARPGDEFIKEMTEYTKTTLHGHEYREVANIEEICSVAADLAKQGVTFSRIDIVSHGQTNIGGVGMTPAGEKKWRYVRPDEVLDYAKKPECKALQSAMAPSGEVRFLGCYLGSVPEAGITYSEVFGASVSSTTGQMKVNTRTFDIGKGRVARSSKDVPKGAQGHFRTWLLDNYKLLQSTGEAPKIEGEDSQASYVTDLFDRSGGKILTRVLEDEHHKTHRPGEADEMRLWKKTAAPSH
jgi:hypothetical protein